MTNYLISKGRRRIAFVAVIDPRALDELLPTAKRYAVGHETVYGIVTGMAALAASLVLFR